MIELFETVPATAWAWQGLGIAIGALGVVLAIPAFRRAATSAGASAMQRAAYWGSLSTSWVWYAMPFLPQPRFAALPRVFEQPGDSWAWAVALAGIVCAAWGGRAAMRTVAANVAATGPGMRDFREPAHLLVSGPYAARRHPMFLYDFVCHLGLALAAGATLTLALLPLYWMQSATFNVIEERWVLAPRFGAAFADYRTRVPFALTPGVAVLLAAVAAAYAATLAFHPV
jgi:protein-S-isoprenylcysteine O-methyltransferase Ste14